MTTTEQRAAPSEIAGPVVQPATAGNLPVSPAGLSAIPARTGDEDAVRAALSSPAAYPATGRPAWTRCVALRRPRGEGLASEVVARRHDTRNPIDRYNRWALSPDLETPPLCGPGS